MVLDEIDIKLLDSLQQNGRIKRNELAESVGLSLPSVSERLLKLENAGIIEGYYTKLDAKKLGKDITAFIFVSVDSSKHYQSFLDHAAHVDEIIECHAVTGEGSHIIKIRTENTSTLEKLLSKIQAWQGVIGTKTHLVLSSSKETTRIKVK
ncbi:MAG: Lrp/AsnC family transcriptional regulator [Ignavibacteriae bacterium]|nr:Lrp/AsnC family transcriptional regulator [Ignavibacteriota bacterium]